MIKDTWLEPLLWWALLSIVATGVCVAAFLAGQQIYRQTLNDPQQQMAEDGALKLASGAVPADIVTRQLALIDIQKSLSPWIAVYDSQGLPLEASGQLNNAPPQPPQGIFDISSWDTRKHWATPAGD